MSDSLSPHQIVGRIKGDLASLYELMSKSNILEKEDKSRFAKLIEEYESFVDGTLNAPVNPEPKEEKPADGVTSMEAGANEVEQAL